MEYICRRKKTKREEFLEIMDEIIPWNEVEDAIYDSHAMRKFMGINFFEQDVPDAATLLHFRHLPEEHGIGRLFFDAINRCLERAGRMVRGGSIVDATLISAPGSTRNAEKKRDPEMHQRPGRLPGVSDNAIDWERTIENRLHVLFASANLYMPARAGGSLRPA